MSRLNSAKALMDAKVEGVAPTVSTLAGETPAKSPVKGTKSKKTTAKANTARAKGRALSDDHSPAQRKTIRCTLSVPPGSQTEQVLLDLIARLPAKSQNRMNVGGMFRDLLEENDEKIAQMLREIIE